MKLNFGKRLILFVHWLVSLIVVASIVFADFTARQVEALRALIGANYTHIAFIAFVVLYVLLSAAVVCLIFRRGKRSDRGFITVDSADTGKVRISVSAIEQMVRQAAHTVDGIADMKIGIESADDAISILINVNMVSGSHVPTVTLNLQRAIRQFVEMNCGVAVRSVSINIQSVTNPAEGGRKARRGESRMAPAVPAEPAVQLDSWRPEPQPVVPESEAYVYAQTVEAAEPSVPVESVETETADPEELTVLDDEEFSGDDEHQN